MKRKGPQLQRGDVISVSWLDICTDPVGNPDHAVPMRRHTIGIFWGRQDWEGRELLVTTDTLDTDSDQSGYTVYPVGCIESVQIIKRARRKP